MPAGYDRKKVEMRFSGDFAPHDTEETAFSSR
jgi:hypothetical protein